MGRAHFRFLKSYLSTPGNVGAVAPSSPYLARRMIEELDLEGADTVVELGPGTGAFTGFILDGLGSGSSLLAVERELTFVEHLRREFPLASVVHDSAENLPTILQQHDRSHADYVVSGLPWAAFDESLQQRLLSAVLDSLRPGGEFTTFAYVGAASLPRGRRFRRLLERSFPSVRKSKVVWRNLPPAFVYTASR